MIEFNILFYSYTQFIIIIYILIYKLLSIIIYGGNNISFDESYLEKAFIELFQEEGYTHIFGKSLERSTNNVLLEEDLKEFLLKKYFDVNLTEYEIQSIINYLKNISSNPLYDANKKFFKILLEGYHLKREDKNQSDLFIKLIDFDEFSNNNFKIINQLPIFDYEKRIPDAIIFINGLPLVVIEFKSAIKENTTIFNAYEQLTIRYQRDIPELFKYNAFIVISDGVNNKYGTLFTEYDYFYGWKKINPKGLELEGIDTAYSLVKGLFNKKRLLNVINNFIYFPDNSNSNKKVICRYPQYFAVTKLHNHILKNKKPDGDGRGGTYFGATGSGKSLAMLYLSRILMKDKTFKNPTILLITDRTDLETQLSELFVNSKEFIGDEKVKKITSKKDLKEELKNRPSGGVYLTNIQKFTEDISLLSERTNIICISDEAHRSQLNLDGKIVINDESGVQRKYGFAKYLHDSLPNAVYVGFTGTPVDETINVFGEIVDSYTMNDAVDDGIIVDLIYNGRAARVNVDERKVDDIEKYYEKCAKDGTNEYQIEASKKAVLSINKIIGDQDRLTRVAEDFINLYETRINENSTVEGKAMFVCSTRKIAYDFYKILAELRPQWIINKYDSSKELSEVDKRKIKEMPMLKMIMTRNKDDEKELYELLGTKENRESDAIQFKNPKSNFKIAIVVDMWLTGFDVPCLDMICIDKPIKMHNLIQTISRVNRVYEGKDKGLIVDYLGIYNAMNSALVKYTNFETEGLDDLTSAITIVKDELSILDGMFHGFDSTMYYNGKPLEKLNCLKDAAEFIQVNEESEKTFMAHVKRLKSAYDLCVVSEDISNNEKDKIFFYTSVRSIIYKLTKGNAPDIARMNSEVSRLVEEAILSDGVEDVFSSNREVTGINLLSEEYISKIASIPRINTKIKILERLIRSEISDFSKINKVKAKSFTEQLNALIDRYNSLRDENATEDILNDFFEELTNLIEDFKKEKESFKDLDMSLEQKAFYDILLIVAEKNGFEYPHDKLLFLSEKVKYEVEEISSFVDWNNRKDIKDKLKADLMILLLENGYPPEFNEDVFVQVFEQAENFKKHENDFVAVI